MEPSILIYLALTLISLAFAAFVNNQSSAFAGAPNGPSPKAATRQAARNRAARFAVYFLLAGVSACRIAVGNDYWVYRFNFRLIAQERHVSSEYGFNWIVRWMQELFGYDRYLPIFGLFSLLTVLFFCLALRDQGESYAFSLFLLLTGGYYFNSLNSVRYYLALAVAMYAMKYVLRSDYLRFAFWILAASSFHKSVLLVIPAYLAAALLARESLWRQLAFRIAFGVLAAVLILSLVFAQGFYREIFFRFYPYYRDSAFDVARISYANLAKCAAVLGVTLVFGRDLLRTDFISRFYFLLNTFGTVVFCCGGFLPESSRIGYYLIASQVFYLPRLLARIASEPWRRFCTAMCIAGFCVYFALLLRGMYATDIRLLPYRNWIFQ